MLVLITLSHPDQPAKTELLAADAVKVTRVPELNLFEQVEPQKIPAGLLVTVPNPVPDLVMLRE